MPRPRAFRELRLLNGSTGDPCLFVDDQGRDNALLIDCGNNAVLGDDRLADLAAVFLTHHHVDHFIGFDRAVRANLDRGAYVAFHANGNGCDTVRTVLQLQPSLRLQYHRNAVPNLFALGAHRRIAIYPKYILPKVGLEPAPSCEDRILSPVRLPYSWYWKHVGLTVKLPF
jgi:glyoxylase-like metal-dependent hydrolase (beta-lactamase superfamily II)